MSTAERVALMRAGKVAADAARRARYAEMEIEVRTYLREDAKRFAAMKQAEDIYGRDSDEFRAAWTHWRAMGPMPKAPPDHAWSTRLVPNASAEAT